MPKEVYSPIVLVLTKRRTEPPRDGGSLRAAALVEELQKMGAHACNLYVPELPIFAATVDRLRGVRHLWRPLIRFRSLALAKWASGQLLKKLEEVQLSADVAVVVFETSFMALYAPKISAPAVIDLQNIEAELMHNYAASASRGWRRLIAAREARVIHEFEAHALFRANAVVVMSDRERAILTKGEPALSDDQIIVGQNGVSDRFFEARRNNHAPIVVFVAHLGWQPNVDAAEWLAGRAWPHVISAVPEAQLWLVGRTPARAVQRLAEAESISLYADVDDVLPYLEQARVATAPLLAAGGTRLKILEALAAGLPVVATSLGALGCDSTAMPGLVIADAPEEFAERLVELLQRQYDPEKCRKSAFGYRWSQTLRPVVDAVARLSAAGR